MSRFKNWNLSWRLKKRNMMLIRMKCLQNFRPKRSNLRKNGPNSSHNSVFLRILVVLLTNLNKWSRRKTSHRVHHRNLNKQSPGQLERPLNPNRKKPRIKLLLINGKFIPKRVNLSQLQRSQKLKLMMFNTTLMAPTSSRKSRVEEKKHKNLSTVMKSLIQTMIPHLDIQRMALLCIRSWNVRKPSKVKTVPCRRTVDIFMMTRMLTFIFSSTWKTNTNSSLGSTSKRSKK